MSIQDPTISTDTAKMAGGKDEPPSPGAILTEDVWFRVKEDGKGDSDSICCIYGSDKDVKTEWDYHRGQDKLTLEVEFKIDALFGKDSGKTFQDVDISEYKQIFKDLGAKDFEKIDVVVKDDKIKIEISAKGIELTDREVEKLPKELYASVEVEDKYGCVSEIDLKLCVDKFKAHSPIAFDLNGDGEIGVTGNSTAQVRADGEIGRTVEFDLDADGNVEQIEWLSGDGDALLVDNRDGNAASDMDGARLFGDQGGTYENGYIKLALFDSDDNGIIDGSELEGLQLWVDDGDAVVEEGELQSLSDHGIASISTGYEFVENERGETLIQSEAISGPGTDAAKTARGEDDPPPATILTEDVWFRVKEDGKGDSDSICCIYGSDKDVKTEWDYHRGQDKLALKVEFKIDALFGKDSGKSFEDVDISEYKQIFKDLGAKDFEKIDVVVKDDKIKIEISAKGIELTDREVEKLPKELYASVEIEDEYGCVSEIDLKLCVDKFKAHSPIALDLNGDGEIGVTGNSTAQVRADGEIGRTVEFDLDADGNVEQIEWLSGDGDALLVDNRDGNAASDMDGARLFGDQGGTYENGYIKLALFDSDDNGIIDGSELEGLQLWVDDGDAVVQEGELQSLSDYGITSIKTGYEFVENDRGETLIQSEAILAAPVDSDMVLI